MGGSPVFCVPTTHPTPQPRPDLACPLFPHSKEEPCRFAPGGLGRGLGEHPAPRALLTSPPACSLPEPLSL